jgi:hypothetical protein
MAMKVSLEALAERAGLTMRQIYRIRKSARAWPREIRALSMALRQIDKERKAEAELFGGTA